MDPKKARKHEAMRQVRIVEAILRRWDPIGVEPGEVFPADEYDRYAPPIVSMVAAGCSVDELARHLGEVGIWVMGTGCVTERDFRFAREIIATLRP